MSEKAVTISRFVGLCVVCAATLVAGWTWANFGVPGIAREGVLRADFYRFAALSLTFGILIAVLWFWLKQAGGGPIAVPAATATEPDAALRGRLAWLVVGLGAAAVVTVSLAAIAVFSFNSNTSQRDTQIMAVLSSVMPVLATWVGTVIAFYFTNESYRQAAESTARFGLHEEDPRVDSTNLMYPYDKFEKIVLEAPKSLGELKREEVLKKFTESTITRVIVVDNRKVALLVIRKNFKDEDFADVDAYQKKYAADATSFAVIERSLSLKRARDLLAATKVKDIFVTENGQPKQPVIGWIPDDRLKA